MRFHSYVSKNLDPLLMFYGSTVEHRQGSRISESHKARHVYERFYGFRALSIIGKCTSRHLFAYGGFLKLL